jgi:hypothetical protein
MAGLVFNAGTAQPPGSSPGGSVVHDYYQVELRVRGDSKILELNQGVFPIKAALPERFNINFSSSWAPAFSKNYVAEAANKFGGPMAEAAVSGAAAVAGVSTKFKHQSAQVWESTSALRFSIDLVFYAKENSEREIRARHKALLQLAAPSTVAGSILVQPGPIIGDKMISDKEGSRRISLMIGRYLLLDDVIITGVSSDVVTLFDEKGIPLSMVINIEVESFYACFTVEDIEAMFKMSGM